MQYFAAKTRPICMELRLGGIHVIDEFYSGSTHVAPHDLITWVAESDEVQSFTITFKDAHSPLGWVQRSVTGDGSTPTIEVHGRVQPSRPALGEDSLHFPYGISLVPLKHGVPQPPVTIDPELVIDPMD
jgi:hypothetical protein